MAMTGHERWAIAQSTSESLLGAARTRTRALGAGDRGSEPNCTTAIAQTFPQNKKMKEQA
eukprot:5408140-Amphidinium_carterae.1